MEFEKIITLIKTVSDSSLTQFTMEEEDFKIAMKTDKQVKMVENAQILSSAHQVGTIPSTVSVSIEENKEEILSGNLIKAPLVGTFYNAPSPDADLFVQAGDTVKKGQVLGIVEAMKLMNEIESEFDGVVEKILVENEAVVEYGQPLFIIK